ncbi:hypothetical protein CLF_102634 [Clonorchis sinensis]|uniref:Uncharacterized protein n=1 Tax=Clonorchis sinensis TaxID=79923 RepID=G7Y896_CLOSI|nr:hypothetical protein CLF_102634 [Clonorchis sinensis]
MNMLRVESILHILNEKGCDIEELSTVTEDNTLRLLYYLLIVSHFIVAEVFAKVIRITDLLANSFVKPMRKDGRRQGVLRIYNDSDRCAQDFRVSWLHSVDVRTTVWPSSTQVGKSMCVTNNWFDLASTVTSMNTVRHTGVQAVTVEMNPKILCGASLPKWINRLASVGAKLPFIERTIPRVWLTPRSLEELNISDSDFPNGSSLGTGRRVLRKRRITSAGVARVHSHSTRHRPQDQSASAVFQLTTSADTHSVAGSSVRTASAAPKEVTTLSDHCISKPSLVSATGRVSRFRTRSSSAVSHQNVPTRCSKSTRDSSEINSVTPKEALSSRLRLPVTTLLAPRRPSSVYIVPSPQNSPQSSACSLVSPNGTLHLVDQLEITSSGHVGTVGAPVKLCSGSVRPSQPFTAGEAVGSMQPESDSPSPVDLTTKTKSHHSFLHSVKSPSSSPSFNCAGSFRNGFLSRLQSLCGTSRTDDSIEKNPLYEPERRTPWSAVYPDA